MTDQMTDLLDELQASVDRARAGRPPGQRPARQPRTPGKVLVELTPPQARVLLDAADRRAALLQGCHADAPVLDRARAALTPHVPDPADLHARAVAEDRTEPMTLAEARHVLSILTEPHVAAPPRNVLARAARRVLAELPGAL